MGSTGRTTIKLGYKAMIAVARGIVNGSEAVILGKKTYWMKSFYDDQMIQIPEDQVQRISLEDVAYTAVLPATHGGFTQLSNYLLQFWTPIIGHQAMALFIHLIMHTYGKEQTWPSIELLSAETNMGKSTIRRELQTLEKYYLIWRIEVKDEDGSNKPNRYVVRQTIPLLPEEEYARLPERLKDSHDNYMETLKESRHLSLHVDLPNYKREPRPERNKGGRPRGNQE